MQFLLWTLYILSIVIGCFVFIGIFIVFAVFIQVSYSNTREIDKTNLYGPYSIVYLRALPAIFVVFFLRKLRIQIIRKRRRLPLEVIDKT